jgi:hypothetical protein
MRDSDENSIVALHRLTREWIDRDATCAYLFGRAGIMAAGACGDPFLMAESHRGQLAVCVNRRFIVEASHHATTAALLYRAPAAAQRATFEPVLVNFNVAWIHFYSDDVDAGIALMTDVGRTLRDTFHDPFRYSVAREHLASMLIQVERYDEALKILVDDAEFIESHDLPQRLAAVQHNLVLCIGKMGGDCPQPMIDRARELVAERIDGQAERSRYLQVGALKKKGKHSEAVSELYKIRAEFEARGDAVIAAATVRAIVQELVALGRVTEAEYIGYPAIETLEANSMLLESRRIRGLLNAPSPHAARA